MSVDQEGSTAYKYGDIVQSIIRWWSGIFEVLNT